jgi:hypothetical protein
MELKTNMKEFKIKLMKILFLIIQHIIAKIFITLNLEKFKNNN